MSPQYIVGGILTAAITGLVAYLVARRTTSGTVKTSSAETLWAEADKLRQTYREESEKNRKESEHLRNEVAGLRDEVQKLREEGAAQRAEAEAQRLESQKLREELAVCKRKLDQAYADLESKRKGESR